MVKVLARRRFATAPAWLEVAAADQAGSNLDLEPPVSGTVYGVMLNLRQALEALGPALDQPPYLKPPRAPILYIKPPNTYRPHDGEVPVPASSPALETSATLAVVIGRTASRTAEADALDHVLGYALAIDVCIPHTNLHRPAIRQRCRDGFLPIGPWITARADVPDPDALEVIVRINGDEASRFSTADLVRPVARLIADVSDFMTLHEGDVLLVGLPPDGPQARAGDRVEAEIAGVGRLSCTLVEEVDA